MKTRQIYCGKEGETWRQISGWNGRTTDIEWRSTGVGENVLGKEREMGIAAVMSGEICKGSVGKIIQFPELKIGS
jgi:hypothetical protein